MTLDKTAEQCGEPTTQPRIFHADQQIWIAQDCPCSLPAAPAGPAIVRQITRVRTVKQVRKAFRKEAA